jgi:hypothetical protein
MIQTYVEFMFPGSFFSETTTRKVSSRVTPTDIPEGAYGYRFFDRQELTEGGETLIGKNTNYSGTTYPGGVTFTVEQVENLPGDYKILASNMRNNGYDLVVRTRRGNFQPFNKDDSL